MGGTAGRRSRKGDRVFEFMGFGPLRFAVGDLDRATAWYVRVLGLEARTLERRVEDGSTDEGNSGRARALFVREAPTPLLELFEEPGARPAAPGGRPGLFHVAFLLPDRAALGRFLAHLMELEISPGAADHGVSEALYLSDADGLGIEVYADRPALQWPRTESGGLRMWTRPLDGGSLIEAARRSEAGVAWTGAPEGTVVGHLHLHTDNLDEAEARVHASLGLRRSLGPDEEREIPGARFLASGGYHHHLGLNLWARHAEPAGPGEARLLEWVAVLRASGGGVPDERVAVDASGVRVRRIAEGAGSESPT